MDEKELINLAKTNDDAKNELYKKYKYIGDILIKKYHSIAGVLNIDVNEMISEASFAFSDAINSYQEDKNTKLATFISLCIDRRLQKLIKKYSSEKARVLNNTYSLDYDYNEDGTTLKDLISDSSSDPLINLAEKQEYEELLSKIKEVLSESEYEVFKLYSNGFDYQTIALITNKNAKQIDNTIQRLKHKIRDIIRKD